MVVNSSGQVASSADALDGSKGWGTVILSLSIAALVFAFTFQREISGAVRVWSESAAYNHCFLVLPLVAVLLWNRREVIASVRPTPSALALVLLPLISTLWMLAALLDIQEAEQLAVVAMFEVLLLVILGWAAYRALLAPLLFLFFLVPFGAFLVPVLQRFTAGFAAHGLQALGIPTFADGFVIEIPEGSFEVAEACAGLRFLIASIVFGCFFATMMYNSRLRRTAFIVLSIVVPIVANGFRALGLIVLAHLEGSAAAMETDHILYGWLFFTLVTLALIAVGMPFADRYHTIKQSVALPVPTRRRRIGVVVAAGLALALVGPTYLATIIESAAAAPFVIPADFLAPGGETGWEREAEHTTSWAPIVKGAAKSSLVTYRAGKDRVTAFVGFYRIPARGSPLTRTVNSISGDDKWHLTSTGQAAALLGRMPIMVNTQTLSRQAQNRLVWWFYIIDDRVTRSTLKAKLMQARAALAGGVHYGALVVVSTDQVGNTADNESLARFVSAIHPTRAWRP